MDITAFSVNPVTLVLLVLFLVQFVKDLGLKGNVLRFVSLAIGGILASVFKARELYPAYIPWIDTGFFMLAVGLGACGAYSFVDESLAKVRPRTK